MLLFAHTGITLGATATATVIYDLAGKRHPILGQWLLAPARFLDIRFLLVGALLSDIIDKPLGLFILRDAIGYGRIYAHTLLFLLILTVAGMILYKRYRFRWIPALLIGSLFHLILDEMWHSPEILFWPFMGTTFPQIDAESWLGGLFHALATQPSLIITESIGFLLLVWFIVSLALHNNMNSFILKGKLRQKG